jgi:hypothetical protein
MDLSGDPVAGDASIGGGTLLWLEREPETAEKPVQGRTADGLSPILSRSGGARARSPNQGRLV